MMVGSCISMLHFYRNYLRRTFTTAGLCPQSIDTDPETTIHFWAPPSTSTKHNKPALVLIHGSGPSAFWQWHNQILFFAPHFSLYIPHLIFYGESTTTSRDRSYMFQAKSLAKMLEKIGVEKYCILDTCYGGFVAYHMAKMSPDRVEKLILAGCDLNWKLRDQAELLALGKGESLEDLFIPKNGKQFKRLLALCMVKHPSLPDFMLQDMVKNLFGENKQEKIQLINDLFRQDNRKYDALQQDVLLLWGQYDQIFRLEKAFELQKIIGERTRLEVIKNTAHFPQVENPNEYNKVLMKFLCS